MYMKYLKASLLVVVCFLTACGGKVDHHGKTPLVEVDGTFLYKEDLKASMPIGCSKEDSLLFAENYIRNWIEDILLYNKAKNNISESQRIEDLVQNYRKSLIIHEYQQKLINQELIANLSDDEMMAFYNNNKDLFKSDETLLKGLYIKVPLKDPDLNKVRIWYKKKDETSIDHLEKCSLMSAVDYIYFYDHWVPVSMLLSRLPDKKNDMEKLLLEKRHIELNDSLYCYFINIDDVLMRGENKPYDAAADEIKEIMINMKQTEFMRNMKNDLYERALEKKDIKYYY